MKLISWNVNGLRACLGKGFAETFAALKAHAAMQGRSAAEEGT